jgi:hypothetical protein
MWNIGRSLVNGTVGLTVTFLVDDTVLAVMGMVLVGT